MRKILIKILEKLIGDHKVERYNESIIEDWLLKAGKSEGFKHYINSSKNVIKNAIARGVDEKKYWRLIGRLKEIEDLDTRVTIAIRNERIREEKKKLKNKIRESVHKFRN